MLLIVMIALVLTLVCVITRLVTNRDEMNRLTVYSIQLSSSLRPFHIRTYPQVSVMTEYDAENIVYDKRVIENLPNYAKFYNFQSNV